MTPNATVDPEGRPPGATETASDKGRPTPAARATRAQPGGTRTANSGPFTGRDPRTGVAPGTGRAVTRAPEPAGPRADGGPSVALVGSEVPPRLATAATASTARASSAKRRSMAPWRRPPRRRAASTWSGG